MIIAALWFFSIPCVSLFGIVAGFIYLLFCDISLSPAIGILLNTINLIVFAMFYYVFFVVGVSV